MSPPLPRVPPPILGAPVLYAPSDSITPQGRGFIVIYAVFPVLATVAVVLRFAANSMKRKSLGADDYTIVVSLILGIASNIKSIWSITQHFTGASATVVTREDEVTRNKLLFSGMIICHAAIGVVKISVVLFYKKIFVTRKFSLAANTMIGIVSAWSIIAFFMALLQVPPVSAWWEIIGPETKKNKNIDTLKFLYGFSLSDMLLDIVIVSMPLPIIGALKLRTHKKFLVSGIFLLGGFCIVCSAIRFHYTSILIKYSPQSLGFREIIDLNELWGQTEANASVLTACLPTLGPLFTGQPNRSLDSIIRSVRSIISLRSKSSCNSTERNISVRRVEEVGKIPGSDWVAEAGHGGNGQDEFAARRAEEGGIFVLKSVKQEY